MSSVFAGEEDLRDLAAAFLDLARGRRKTPPEGSELVKANRLRSVFHLPALALFVKVHRPRGGWRRISSIWRGPDALREWRAALRLQERGLPLARPRAVSYSRRLLRSGAGVYLCAAIPGARSARDLWDDVGVDRTAVAASIARQIADMHLAGVEHRDLHAANLLASRGSDGSLVFAWIDLKSARATNPGHSLGRRRSARELATFVLSLAPRGGSRGRDALAIAAAYGREMTMDPTWFAVLERSIGRVARRRLASRAKRCTRESTAFHLSRGPGWKACQRREFSESPLTEISPEKEPCDEVLKHTRGVRVWRVGERVYKYQYLRSWRRRFELRLGLGRARRAWKFLHRADLLGIPAPRGIALLEMWRPRSSAHSLLVTTRVPAAVDLKRFVQGEWPRLGRTQRQALLQDLAAIVAAMIRAGIRQGDLALKNILIREAGARRALCLVDFESFKRSRWSAREREKALLQLNDCPRWLVSSADRIRFLRQLEALVDWRASRGALRRIARGTAKRCRRSGRTFSLQEGEEIAFPGNSQSG